MRNQRGFTLIELLAVIVILAILTFVALPAVSLFQNQTEESYYTSLERTVLFAGRNYYSDRMTLLPREIGDESRVLLDDLVRFDYLEQPLSTAGNACIGSVGVKKTDRNFEYDVCLKCDGYINNESCNFDGSVDDGGTESDYLTLDHTYFEVGRGEPFVPEYAKYYHNGELVKSDIAPNPSWIDTSVLETYTLTYTYKNLSITATVKVVDTTPPSATVVEMRKGSLDGVVYTSGWANQDVYQIYSSSDDEGGSGIKGYAVSLVNRPSDSTSWTLIQGNYITQKDLVTMQGRSGTDFNGTVYVWVVDQYDNFGPVTSYQVSVDQTAPTIPAVTNPTNGNWTNQDIYLTLNSSDAFSGISYYQYSYDNSSWNTYADSAKTTYITTPYSAERNQAAYLRACDYVGNCSGSASTMIRIDKTAPIIYGSNLTIRRGEERLWEGITYSDSASGVNSHWASISSTASLGVGNHVVTYYVNDWAGNQNQLTRTITVTGPMITNLIQNPGFDNCTKIPNQYPRASIPGWVVDGDVYCENGGGAGGAYNYFHSAYSVGIGKAYQNVNIIQGHVYYMRATVRTTSSVGMNPIVSLVDNARIAASSGNAWSTQSRYFTATSGGVKQFRVGVLVAHIGQFSDVSSPMLIDLTATYGAGNEPSQAVMDSVGYFAGSIVGP